MQQKKEKKKRKKIWNLGFYASFYTFLLGEEIKKLSYLAILCLVFNLELFVTTNRRDCFQHHAKSCSLFQTPRTVPPPSTPGFSPAGRWGWRENTTLSSIQTRAGHAERDPAVTGRLGAFLVPDKDCEGKGKVPEAVGGTWHCVALSK